MTRYLVEVHSEVREVYEVEAGSADHALDIWTDGTRIHSESSSCDAVSVEPAETDR
jgi:hypothetical protein